MLGMVRISGSSMYPEVKDGDIVFYNRMDKSCNRGDIVIVYDPALQVYYIKRVIANAGEVVTLTPDGGVSVDGVLLDEPYVGQLKTTAQDVEFPVTVPEGSIFVLGDNRPVSKDSRNSTIGMVPSEQIYGGIILSIRLYQ